jgi:cyclopropane-fatty-acyl-phospholipid synthase
MPGSPNISSPTPCCPTAQEIPEACAGKFVIEDWHNLGGDYIKTLRSWYQNFTAHWNVLKKHYDEQFYRMWTYYLFLFRRGQDIENESPLVME